MKRKVGFYWIKINGIWRTAYFDGEVWFLPGVEELFWDNELDEIHETQLKPPKK